MATMKSRNSSRMSLGLVTALAFITLLLIAAPWSLVSARLYAHASPQGRSEKTGSNAEGRALLAKAVEGLGGGANVRSVRAIRVIGVEGQTTVQTVFLLPDKFWQKVTTPKGQRIIVVSPKAAFATSQEQRANLDPWERKEILRSLGRDPIFVAQHADDPNFVFRGGGSAKIGGIRVDILDVSHPKSKVRWFIDPQTGRILRATYEQGGLIEDEDGTEIVEDYSDWRSVRGVWFAFKETDSYAGSGAQSLEIKKVEINPQIEMKIFLQPGSEAEPTASNAQGRDLLARVIQALGGEAKVRELKALRAKGSKRLKTRYREEVSEFELAFVFPDRLWERRVIPRTRAMSVVISPRGSFNTIGTETEDISEEAIDEVLTEAGMDPRRDPIFLVKHADDPNYVFYGRGSAKLGDVEAPILDVIYPEGEVRWFIDPQSGRVLRASWKFAEMGGSVQMVRDYAEWKSVQRIWLPFKEVDIPDRGDVRWFEFEFAEIQANPAIDPKIFEKPVFPLVKRPEIKALVQSRSIRIRDDWNGLGLGQTAHYNLRRSANRFKGNATFTVGRLSRVETISIPLDVVQTFLRTLGDSPLENRKYSPRIRHTDDYPSLRIELELENKTVSFITESQGKNHVPWAVTIQGKTYVIESDVPARALATLDPYLKHEVLRELKEKARSSP